MTPFFENGHVTFLDDLKGSSNERKSLREFQGKEYLDLLGKDQEKEQTNKESFKKNA